MEPTVTDVTAESSAATSIPAEPSIKDFQSEDAIVDVEKFTPTERAEWLRTGGPPKRQKADSPTAQETAGAEAGTDVTAESSPAPDKAESPRPSDGKVQQEYKARTEARFNELLEANRTLRAEVEALRNGSYRTPPPEQSAPAPPKLELPPRPKLDDFETVAEWQQKDVEWLDQRDAIRDHQRAAKANETALKLVAEEQQLNFVRTQEAREAEAIKQWPDFQDVTLKALEAFKQTRHPAIFGNYILDSPNGPAVFRHLGLNLAEITRIAALPPYQALGELALIERSLTNGAKNGAAPPAKEQTQRAPLSPPPTELTGGNTTPEDPVKAALQSGDFTAYRRLMNERDAKSLSLRR